MTEISTAQTPPARAGLFGSGALSHALPFLILLVIGLALPLFAGGYWGVIATRACVYWVLVAGLNLVVGFAGQLAIGWVALLTLGAYTTSVLAAGNVMPALPPYLALAIAGVVGAVFGVIVGLPALRLRTFYFAITTLGFATIVTQIALAWTSVTGGGVGVPGPVLAGAVRFAMGLLLFLLRPRGDLHLDDGEHRGEPLRPRAHRDPRRRGRGGSERHLQARAAGHRVPVQRRARGDRRRIVRLVAVLHHAGRLHVRPVGPVLHRDPDRRARLDPRAAARHDPAHGACPSSRRRWSRGRPSSTRCCSSSSCWRCPGGIAELLDFKNRRPLQSNRAIVPRPDLLPRLLGSNRDPGLLTLEQVALSFGGVRAIDGLDLEIRPGQVHGLIGPNGSGKTTTLNVISGYYAPQSGAAKLNGAVLPPLVRHTRARMRIARTFQTPRLVGEASVLENVMIGGTIDGRGTFVESLLSLPRHRRDEAMLRETAMLALSAVGLEQLAAVRADRLQHSELRFVEIARALMLRPAFLLLDEPAAGLSAEEIRRLGALLVEIAKTGTGVLLVEHHADLIFDICHHVTVLNLGKMLAAGTPAEIRSHREVVNAYLGG